jgi:tetratricopeptide (TPR) repeat protein
MNFIKNFFSLLKYKKALTKGLDLYQKKEYTNAIPFFDDAVNYRPNDHHSFYIRGLTHQTLGNIEKAIADFDAALVLNPEEVKNIYYFRGLAHMQLKDYKAAIEDFDNTIKENAEDPVPYYKKALCQQESGDIDNAMEALDKAIELNDQFGDAYFVRSLLNFEKENTPAALLDAKRAIELGGAEYAEEISELQDKIDLLTTNDE